MHPFVNRVLWVPQDILLLYWVRGRVTSFHLKTQLTRGHNVFFLSWGRTNNLIICTVSRWTKGIKRLFHGLLVTNHKLMLCLPLHWLYIVFYDYSVFILFDFFFLICLWFLTGTGSDFLCLGVRVRGYSVWPLWPPCHFSGTCRLRWYFSAWEQSTNTSCYNSLSSACLSHFFLWTGQTARDYGKALINMNIKFYSWTLFS